MNFLNFDVSNQDQNNVAQSTFEKFDDVLAFVSQEGLENVGLNRFEPDWENIPLIIPQSVLMLEKNIQKVKSWCLSTEKQINYLLSGIMMKEIEESVKSHKLQNEEFSVKVEKKIETIFQEISDIHKNEKEIKLRDDSEKVEEVFFDKYFHQDNEPLPAFQEHKYLKPILDGINKAEDYEIPRRYSLNNLHYIIFKMMNQSKLQKKVAKLDVDVKEVEMKLEKKIKEKYEELSLKCHEIDHRLTNENKVLKADSDKKAKDLLEYVNDEILPRIAEEEKAIRTSLQMLEELKIETNRNSAFRERAEQNFEELFRTSDKFFSLYEKKIAFYDANFDDVKHKTEEKLANFTNIINEKFAFLRKETSVLTEHIKVDLTNYFVEANKKNLEAAEKLIAVNTRHIQTVEFENKRAIENFKIDINFFNSENQKIHEIADEKLETFIKKFEVYCKTKIEPAFNSEAKVHALESKFEEQEQFFSYATLFTKDVLKKLIYAIQKHNLGAHKWVDEKRVKLKKDASPKIYVTETQDVHNTTQNDTISNDETPSVKISTLQDWRQKTHTSFGSRRASDKFNILSLKPDLDHSFARESPDGLPNLIKPQKRRNSTEMEERDVVLDPNEEAINKQEQNEFDKMFHKRLEALREALVNERAISQKFNKVAANDAVSQVKTVPDTIPRNSVLAFYKDIDMVKITKSGAKRKHSEVPQKLNKTFTEFNDQHLLKDTN